MGLGSWDSPSPSALSMPAVWLCHPLQAVAHTVSVRPSPMKSTYVIEIWAEQEQKNAALHQIVQRHPAPADSGPTCRRPSSPWPTRMKDESCSGVVATNTVLCWGVRPTLIT